MRKAVKIILGAPIKYFQKRKHKSSNPPSYLVLAGGPGGPAADWDT